MKKNSILIIMTIILLFGAMIWFIVVGNNSDTSYPQYIYGAYLEEHHSLVNGWNHVFLEQIAGNETNPLEAVYVLNAAFSTTLYAIDTVEHSKKEQQLVIDSAMTYVLGVLFPQEKTLAGQIMKRHQQDTGNRELIQKVRLQAEKYMTTNDIELIDFEQLTLDATRAQSAPGQWEPTGPEYWKAMRKDWAKKETIISQNSTLELPAPPSLDSEQYARELQEVYELGGVTSQKRTQDQEVIAHYWRDGGGTYTPVGHWNVILQKMIEPNTPYRDQVEYFAILNTALYDTSILVWKEKYKYNFWRPVTAISNAHVDNNPGTERDLTWTNYIDNPNFPDYPSGHSAFSQSAATIISQIRSDGFVESYSLGMPGVSRQYDSLQHAADEAGLSRIYGGIHFQSAHKQGQVLGKKVSTQVLEMWGSYWSSTIDL